MCKKNFMMMDNNSVNKFKPSIDCENSLEKNEQEVLVLPPILLQQLGIHLGNIPNTSDYPIVKGIVEAGDLQNGEKPEINSEQLDNVAEEVTGHEKSVQLSLPLLFSVNIPQHREYITGNNDVCTFNIDQNNINVNTDNQKTFNNTDSQIQSRVVSNFNVKYPNKTNLCNDKETECLKIGEFNSLSPKSSQLNCSNRKKSKINIISQEVVKHGSSETFNPIKLGSTTKNALIPFNINLPIQKVPKNYLISDNIISKTSENSISFEPKFESNKMLQRKDSACSTHSDNDFNKNKIILSDIDAADGLAPDTNKKLDCSDIDNENIDDNETKDEVEIYCVIDDEMSNLSEQSNLETCTDNKTVDIDVSVETPTPSTSLVSQKSVNNTLNDLHKIKVKDFDEDVEVYIERNNNISESCDESDISASDKQSMDDSVTQKPYYVNQCVPQKVNLSPNHLTTKSKLCIQGVEKPGGTIENNKLQTEKNTLRTYQSKKNKNRLKNKTSDLILVNELTANIYEIADVCTDFNNINVSCVTKQICTCNEFGRLQFDDSENEHGHLHFLPKNIVNSKPSIMCEIVGEEHASDEEILLETDNNFDDDDVQLNDLSYVHTEGSFSESDISDQFNEDQKLFSSETCLNIFDESMNHTYFDSKDDIINDDLYSFTPEVNKVHVFEEDESLVHNSSNEKLENFVIGTHSNYYRRISTAEEGGEKSDACRTKKRKRTFNEDEEVMNLQCDDENYNVPEVKKFISCVKCAVCRKEIAEVDWDTHLSENHCHIAWKQGSSVIDLEDEELIKKLSNTLKKVNRLYCTFCGRKEKDLKKMLAHFKICITKIFTNVNNVNAYFSEVDVTIENDDTVKCEICCQNVLTVQWMEHMNKRHIGAKTHMPLLPAPIENIINTEPLEKQDVKLEVVKCGVCKIDVNSFDWPGHVQKEHNYLAWKEGDPALNLDDERNIYNYLRNILNNVEALVCAKCYMVYLYPKNFMKHIKTCNGKSVRENDSNDPEVSSHNQSVDYVNQSQDDADKLLDFNGSVECGVCSQEVAGSKWLDHIQKEHNYLAKIRGVPPLDLENDEMVRKHLQGIRLITRHFTCAKCGLKRKIIKNFLEHIKECDGTTKKLNESNKNVESDLDRTKEVVIWENMPLQYSGTVKCGVCKDEVDGEQWLQHIQKKHDYIAWIEGAQPLNFLMEEQKWQYLNHVTKQTGVLICGKCGLNRKYGKAYLQHVKECDGSKAALVDQLNDSQMIENNINSTYLEDCTNSSGRVKCGVCAEEVEGEVWLQHIQKKHGYIAWVEGRAPINREDKDLINTYLKLLIRRIGALVCGKCGLHRKIAKSYLHHVSKCSETKEEAELGSREMAEEEQNEFIHSEPVQCGACLQRVQGAQWIAHIRLKHDYLARIAGKPPLDVNDGDQVRKHLSAMKKYVEQLVCNNCGEGRKHVGAFLNHVQYCDGAEKSDNGSEDMENEEESFVPSGTVQCGVCKKEVDGEEWINHIQKEHDYMATIEGRPPLVLDNEEEIRTHLNTIRRHVRELVCNKCGVTRKFVKSYMKHVKNCNINERLSTETAVESRRDSAASVPTEEEHLQLEFPGPVVCGVCGKGVYGNQWLHHIRKEHNYMAHVKGKTPLDINDMKQMKAHLAAVSKLAGGLYCNKCGLMRLYVKSYLAHFKQCSTSDNPLTIDANESEVKKERDESFKSIDTPKVSEESVNNIDDSQFMYEGISKCGVCQSEVRGQDWIEHIQKEHNYLAWIDGQPPLDLEDQEQVHAHLYELSRLQNGLTCNICNAKRKYVKSFLDHIRNCNVPMSEISQGTLVECAVCSEKMPVEGWKSHAMKKHYNIAWTVGSDPIDLKNPYAVEKYLKEYKKIYRNLICKICKLSRVSCAGFYAHIITCGKTDEEIEDYKSVCDICYSKYLCIYKNQHLAFHREQEYVKEKKSRALEMAQSKADEGTSGRRKAAEKAKTVIEDYKSSLNKLKYKCDSCGFGTEVEEELEGHACEAAGDRLTDSDASASVQLDAHSHSDTDSDLDSNVSMEEEDQQPIDKKKRVDTPAKLSHHIPFKINSASNYVSQAALDFYNTHYTSDELFPDWKPTEYREVDAEDLPKYMPTVKESCKVKIGNEQWITYKLFEAKNDTVLSMFVGGSIRCVSWAAARCVVGGASGAGGVGGAEAAEGSYLAVAGHGAPDAPRLPADQLCQHPALLQLWDFADFDSLPKFVLGLALEYGTVWAMEWCPSGARDCPPPARARRSAARLGLLALACSNGSAYILPVPYPNYNAQEPQIIKIKASVELRLCASEGRRKYQATAISWSKQKGHTIILVGYADGSTAFYDLDCDSPLLKSVENDVTILYPFQDDRPHNTCISDVGLFAGGVTGGGAWGAWGGASCTGVHAALRAGAPRLHAPLATATALFTPHWPSLLVTADEAIANYMTNELEWHGGGRRLGGQRALATCERCGAAAAFTPPALRLMRTHPAYRDPRRDVVGILRMAPLAKKRSKHINDELSMKVEPLTYEDAVKDYGIELKLKCHMTKADQQVVVSEAKAQFPERFPLAEVGGLAFCPARAAHRHLALPTHSGLLFILTM